jgi:hypothetical protein
MYQREVVQLSLSIDSTKKNAYQAVSIWVVSLATGWCCFDDTDSVVSLLSDNENGFNVLEGARGSVGRNVRPDKVNEFT